MVDSMKRRPCPPATEDVSPSHSAGQKPCLIDKIKEVVRSFEQRNVGVFPYPSLDVAGQIASLVGGGCRVKHVNNAIVCLRNERLPPKLASYFYFLMFKPKGYSSMRDATKFKSRHPSVYSLLPEKWPQVPHVGRLDVDTEGLLLFTDDGRLHSALIDGAAKKNHGPRSTPTTVKMYIVEVNIMSSKTRNCNLRRIRAKFDRSKEQRSRAKSSRTKLLVGDVDVAEASALASAPANESIGIAECFLDSLRRPLAYPDGSLTRPAIEVGDCTDDVVSSTGRFHFLVNAPAVHSDGSIETESQSTAPTNKTSRWIKVCISEGKNRQVRRLCARAQLDVLRLVRVSIGPVALAVQKPHHDSMTDSPLLSPLQSGECRSLTQDEVTACYRACSVLPPIPKVLVVPVSTKATPPEAVGRQSIGPPRDNDNNPPRRKVDEIASELCSSK